MIERHLKIDAKMERVREACEFVAQLAEEAGFDARAAYHIEIAVDEVCTNIVEHGFAPHKGAASGGYIALNVRFDDPCLKMAISDNSPQFDPTTQAKVDMDNDHYKREPGGWGLHFVRQLMDEVEYGYAEGQNHLTLTKCLPAPAAVLVESHDFRVQTGDTHKNYQVLRLFGRLDGVSAPALKQSLAQMTTGGKSRLILDMAGVDYISSSGLKVMASVWRDCREHEGNLLLAGLNERLQDIFDIVGFNTFFDIYTDTDAAFEAIQG